jgi:hypothetical protein
VAAERESPRDQLEAERTSAGRLQARSIVFDDTTQLASIIELRGDRDFAALAAAQGAVLDRVLDQRLQQHAWDLQALARLCHFPSKPHLVPDLDHSRVAA